MTCSEWRLRWSKRGTLGGGDALCAVRIYSSIRLVEFIENYLDQENMTQTLRTMRVCDGGGDDD